MNAAQMSRDVLATHRPGKNGVEVSWPKDFPMCYWPMCPAEPPGSDQQRLARAAQGAPEKSIPYSLSGPLRESSLAANAKVCSSQGWPRKIVDFVH